jgi:RND family efflux transporter MFP subunit
MKTKLAFFTVSLLTLMAMSNFDAHAETITITGAQLKWVDDVSVSSRDAGIVEKIEIKPNDNLEKGATIVQLDNAVQLNESEGAKQRWEIATEEIKNDVNLQYAIKTAEVAKKELERSRAANAQVAQAISLTEMEQKQLEVEQAMLSGEQAKHELSINRLNTNVRENEFKLAQLKLKNRTITTPIAGQVAEGAVQEGEWVDVGQPVARIVNLNTLRVIALVPEKHVLAISRGQSASLKLKVGNESMEAKGAVSYISPEINPVNREFIIWVDIANMDGKLRPGLVGTLTIETN